MAEVYPVIEVYRRNRGYVNCQIISKAFGFIVCQPIGATEQFMAKQRMGCWMQIDLDAALKEIEDRVAAMPPDEPIGPQLRAFKDEPGVFDALNEHYRKSGQHPSSS